MKRDVRTMSAAEAAAAFPVAKSRPAPQNARAVLDRSMDEDSLLVAVTDALTVYGWKWSHVRRSDRALMMGHKGLPDVIAARRGRVLFIELKSAIGVVDQDQWAWAFAIGGQAAGDMDRIGTTQYRLWRPSDLDAALAELARP